MIFDSSFAVSKTADLFIEVLNHLSSSILFAGGSSLQISFLFGKYY